MTGRLCVNCGELYDDHKRLVCPHCGVDVDYVDTGEGYEATYSEDPDEGYEEFLEQEGLAERTTRKGCGVILLLGIGVPISAPLLLLL